MGSDAQYCEGDRDERDVPAVVFEAIYPRDSLQEPDIPRVEHALAGYIRSLLHIQRLDPFPAQSGDETRHH